MIGIDFGSKSIKLIELVKDQNSWSLKSSGAIGYTGIPVDKMTDDKDLVALSEVLKKFVKQVGINGKDVNVSVPEDLVFTRMIKFPMLSDEEIASAVKWESEQYIPIPVNEAVIQYIVLEKSEATASVSVLLVAVPKLIVEKYVKLLRLVGLNPESAETELIAASRSLAPSTGSSILLDFGATSSDIAIIKDGKLTFSRSIPVAGDALTRAVSQSFNITAEQAEEYKKTYGLDKDQLEGKVKAAINPVFQIVVDEIKKAIHYFQSDVKGDMPTSIVVTGGASGMPGLVQQLTESLGIEAIIGDPFSKVILDPETKKGLMPYASLYGVAVGLAMRYE